MLQGMQLLQTRLTAELGIRYPFVSAGMGFVAHERLAAAVTNAGGLGFLGASPDPPDSLWVMVDRLRRLSSGPFGVDLICATLPNGPASTDAHIDLCVELGVKLVAFHHELPPRRWVEQLAAAGARVWQQASSVALARAAVELGITGIVAQGVEAGGHCESTVPVLELVAQVRREFPHGARAGGGRDRARAARRRGAGGGRRRRVGRHAPDRV